MIFLRNRSFLCLKRNDFIFTAKTIQDKEMKFGMYMYNLLVNIMELLKDKTHHFSFLFNNKLDLSETWMKENVNRLGTIKIKTQSFL